MKGSTPREQRERGYAEGHRDAWRAVLGLAMEELDSADEAPEAMAAEREDVARELRSWLAALGEAPVGGSATHLLAQLEPHVRRYAAMVASLRRLREAGRGLEIHVYEDGFSSSRPYDGIRAGSVGRSRTRGPLAELVVQQVDALLGRVGR